MSNKTLHYLLDPLCGWCYAAGPLAKALHEQGIPVQLHAGGLFDRQTMPEHMRAYVRQADARISAMTGQPLGQAYLQGLLNRADTVLDSLPPIAALLAAQELDPARGLPMLHALQTARWVDGLEIVDSAVLQQLAVQLGLDGATFEAALQRQLQGDAQDHIDATRRFMGAVGVQGFPGFVLRSEQGAQVLNHSRFYGHANEWVQHIQTTLA
ncbi:DsbA family protein [Curvibacter sp. CHRR-16]|uniref:DsbA family protein n=1 Tax=Curvibacter sp. CHRR-16 TaxID=2835872 RepID=UPI001BDAB14F|nr:DsbA family protein [Curvibacter sp. CHRR-16]MBT0570689.1 DsbA family protein [Curvibacter sp. CHRR-16]